MSAVARALKSATVIPARLAVYGLALYLAAQPEDNEEDEIVWIELGPNAHVAVSDDRVAGVLYWKPADVGEFADPDREPVVLDSGFFYAPSDTPHDHHFVLAGPCDPECWTLALEHASALTAVTGEQLRCLPHRNPVVVFANSAAMGR